MSNFSEAALALDLDAEIERICKALREQVANVLNRRGAVLGLSGGIDSSLVAALCARALGARRVRGLLMCERDSSSETLDLSKKAAAAFDIPTEMEDITDILAAFGCYSRRDDAIRAVVPEYREGWKSKIVLPSAIEKKEGGYNVYSIVVESPDGEQIKKRLPPQAYLGIVAATNFKQRSRKTLEYYWADRLNYVVAGTPNRLEYDQGFFVKNGDGAADVKPIAHLYKTQVYTMARHIGVPEEICSREPTTDTYTLEQGQDEFYFSLPYQKMDLCLYGKNHSIAPADVAAATDLTPQQVEAVFADIDRKRITTRYMHQPPLLAVNVPELH